MEYIVYLQKNGTYVEGVRCKNQEEIEIVIDNAEGYERYLLVGRDVNLNIPMVLEYGDIKANTPLKKGR